MNKVFGTSIISVGIFLALLPGILNAGIDRSWTYGGINLGGVHSVSSYNTNPKCAIDPGDGVFCSTGAFLPNGADVKSAAKGRLSRPVFVGGLQVGRNWQTGNYIYGAEVDFDIFKLRKSVDMLRPFSVAFLGNAYTIRQSVTTDWLSTFRGKAAYLVNGTPISLYGTAGFAFTNYKVSSRYYDNAIGIGFPGGFGIGHDSKIKPGITIGGGGEWLYSKELSLKLEYLYLNFDSLKLKVPTWNTAAFYQQMSVKYKLDAHMIRLGFNYKLDPLIDRLWQ